MKRLEGKTAVVTGAASGIGRAIALRLAAEGMNVVIGDIEEGAIDGAVDEVKAAGAECIGVPTDVTDPQSVDALAARTLEQFGSLHVACNNAGVFAGGLLWEQSLDDYEWVIDVNLRGVVNGIRSFVPIMVASDDECHVVNTASMAGLTTMPYAGVYHLTKHAVLALSECLFHELSIHAPHVGVSALCPEGVATNIDRAERNRPASLGHVVESAERTLVHDAIAQTVESGVPPSHMADRVLTGIRENRFYLLSDDAWRTSAETRMEDIRAGRNPTLAPPL